MKEFWLGILGIVILLAGCSRSVDSRLLLADSLIDENADSAYIVLKGIDSHELTSNCDKAYYALLYTQAQYKNFDSIPNDSLINIALHHYSDNHNRERYTRTLIYKGAVMQELGKEEEAMEWYKRAEDNASEDDYMNLGQVNLRMSVLYDINYADIDESIDKERKALYYFRKAGSRRYELMCLGGLGGGYRINNMDSAYYYLHQAIDLARELKDDENLYSCTEMLARAMIYDSLYVDAKNLAISYLNNEDYVDDDIYYDIAHSYANLGMPDSAQFYFDKTSDPIDEDMKVTRLIVFSQITEVKNNYDKAYKYSRLADSIAYKLVKEGKFKDREFKSIDKIFESDKLVKLRVEKNNQLRLFLFVLCLVIVLGVLIFVFIYRRHIAKIENAKNLIRTLNQEREKLLNVQDKISTNKKFFAEYHFNLMNELIECSYVYSNQPEKFIKRFNGILEEGKPKKQFWEMLYIYIDENNNNFLSNLRKTYPELNEDEIKIIAMLSCGYTSFYISIYLGFTNNTYIYKKKKLIAKKMNISIGLDEFVKKCVHTKNVH